MLFLTTIVIALLAYANAQTTYTIQSGDTYCSIAQTYGCTSWTVLQQINGYNQYDLIPGQPMTIPGYPSCTGSNSCVYVSIPPGATYTSLAATYNMDVNCLINANCNATLLAYGTICISKACPAPIAATTVATTAAPLNGFVNGVFYCNGVQSAVAQSPNVQNCGGVYYTNGAVANGYVGSTFYCNGIPTPNSNGVTCGGQYYVNGNVANGVFGSTFYCNGLNQGTPQLTISNCGGTDYYDGSIANGWINGQFYCNGQPNLQAAQICNGQYYQNGALGSGYFNGQFYCNGIPLNSATGVCGGNYYQNGVLVNSCNVALAVPAAETCAKFLASNPGYTQQELINCNPSLGLSTTSCNLPKGTVFV